MDGTRSSSDAASRGRSACTRPGRSTPRVQIFDFAPIRALDVGPRGRPDVDAVADWPHLARLHRLEFSNAHFGADEAERLGNSPYAAALTELAFEFDGITADGLEAVLRSPLFARLTALDLRSNAIPPALLVDALGAVRRPGTLARLSLAASKLTGRDAEHLFALPVMRGLTHLDLSDNPFLGPSGARHSPRAASSKRSSILDLEDTHPGVPGIRALAESGALASVRSLDLVGMRLGPRGGEGARGVGRPSAASACSTCPGIGFATLGQLRSPTLRHSRDFWNSTWPTPN